MYRKRVKHPEFEDFVLPFGGRLRSDNRWVVLSKIIPWEYIEHEYTTNLADTGMGAPAKSARVAFGSLIIKEKLGLTDDEVANQIQENPYLQYFIGYGSYRDELPFDPSMMVHFRKRFNLKSLSEINEIIIKGRNKPIKPKKKERDKNQDENNDKDKPKKGKLIIDTTCAPQDIRYPIDLSLLNEAREKTEHIIDVLYTPLKGKEKKPRTYRRSARKEYLLCAKKKKATKKQIRKAIRKQLSYVRRNLIYIKILTQKSDLRLLSIKSYKDLLVIQELYRQQQYMYDNEIHKITGRIVSISQPHVRPIVRGKVAAPVEFGAKIAISLINGYSFIDRLSWEPYHESVDLIQQIQTYYNRFGYYPRAIHADKIYRTRENIKYCKQIGIRISGPALGRPMKPILMNEKEIKRIKTMIKQDEKDRIPIEGKIGEGKRRYNLDLIMTKLANTSETAISLVFIVMNMEKLLREFFFFLKYLIEKSFKICFFSALDELKLNGSLEIWHFC